MNPEISTGPPFADGSRVAPAFAEYTRDLIYGELPARPGLSQRDKPMLTCAALMAMKDSEPLAYYAGQALDHGLTARELGEVVTQLAVYCGWPPASKAVTILTQVFSERGISGEDLARLGEEPLKPDPDTEEKRASDLKGAIVQVSPPLAEYSNKLLFGDFGYILNWRPATAVW